MLYHRQLNRIVARWQALIGIAFNPYPARTTLHARARSEVARQTRPHRDDMS